MTVFINPVIELEEFRDRRTRRNLLLLAVAETAAEMRCEGRLPGLAAVLTNGRTTDYRELTCEEAERMLEQFV